MSATEHESNCTCGCYHEATYRLEGSIILTGEEGRIASHVELWRTLEGLNNEIAILRRVLLYLHIGLASISEAKVPEPFATTIRSMFQTALLPAEQLSARLTPTMLLEMCGMQDLPEAGETVALLRKYGALMPEEDGA